MKWTFSWWILTTCNGRLIVAEPAVVNASPLIFLTGVGLTELAQLVLEKADVP